MSSYTLSFTFISCLEIILISATSSLILLKTVHVHLVHYKSLSFLKAYHISMVLWVWLFSQDNLWVHFLKILMSIADAWFKTKKTVSLFSKNCTVTFNVFLNHENDIFFSKLCMVTSNQFFHVINDWHHEHRVFLRQFSPEPR